MKDLLINILLRLLRLEPYERTLPKEVEDGLMSQMWENPAFRKHVAARDKKLIYQMAGGEGMQAEPQRTYLMHTGQRVENLLLARDAKAAYNRLQKQREMASAQKASE